MDNSVYKSCKEFLKKYPGTIAWRIKKHAKVVEEHINDQSPLKCVLTCP